MPTALQYLESVKPRKYRVYVVFGEDHAQRVDSLARIRQVVAPSEEFSFHAGDGVSASSVWDAVTTRPMPGVRSRMVVIHSADRLSVWGPLKEFIDGASVFPETTLVLALDRDQLGVRQRSRSKSIPGAAVWETVFAEWEGWLDAYSAAGLIRCSELSVDPNDRGKSSPVCRWLSLRLPMSQRQAEYLWRRVGGSSLLARDAVQALRLLKLTDATGLPSSTFAGYVDLVVGLHGAEDLVDQLLFARKAEAFASVAEQAFTRADWGRILALLAQRLDWLGPLHVALATNEQLDQVMRRLGIHRKWILYYADRHDPAHNVARHFDSKKVAKCRRLIADMDSRLGQSKGVPEGFGEALVASW